jgi:hypothetical protein
VQHALVVQSLPPLPARPRRSGHSSTERPGSAQHRVSNCARDAVVAIPIPMFVA